ncbi:hypothetical protein L2747_18830 [Shewanella marinintestina]|uniref:hypothetical protein n=1 Tax=Shewanella marinintestina TaxID=190305 RepID=UPI00200DC197|nr:hypothetical protein [Shewanella marinintestina]MCL1148062.1 hypothetical protein [Shewanella marinintestina]
METYPEPTTSSPEGNQHLGMLFDKHPAEISLNDPDSQRYLKKVYPNASINTITRVRFMWEGVINEDYFAIFQSNSAMMAIHVDSSGSAILNFPIGFWTEDEHAGHTPRSCISAFQAELSEISDWNPAPFNQLRQRACSLLSWWQDEAFIREAEQLKLNHTTSDLEH